MITKHYSGRRSPFPTIGKVIFTFLGILVLLSVCLLLFALITEYRPEDTTRLDVTDSAGPQMIRVGQTLSLLSFNIGFCGMDAAQDIYTEDGQRSRAGSRADVEANLAAVSDFLRECKPSFLFLQEVDVNSNRSHGVDQRAALEGLFPAYSASFALDYKSPYVLLPLSSPTGNMESGLLSLLSVSVREGTRVSFQGDRSFFTRLFSPNECFLVTRMAVEAGGELVLINARFADTSDGGALRAGQLEQMRVFLEEEAEKGNYVILGGDFAGQLPGTDSRVFGHRRYAPDWCEPLPEDYLPAGYRWASDYDIPTRRAGDIPYVMGESYTAVMDGFLVSSNIEISSVNAFDLGFRNAAHNPVQLVFSLVGA
ncbi:MAG: hypothetical protein FWE59_01905 [Oscillospiraceae bacterium]|nr:hypothetical protein [Oscillospiraceae bacterium]